jgi:diphthine synthase
MLHFLGLGLYDEKDMSLRALETLRSADAVYAEFYTNPFQGDVSRIEALAGKPVRVLSRQDLEEHPEDNVLRDSKQKDVVLLVGGDPMVATTHSDLILRARKMGVEVKIVHASSIISAVAESGLQIYKFGRTASIPYPEGNYFPTSPYDTLRENIRNGAHTLFLLDIKADEKRYMSVSEAVGLLLRMEDAKKGGVFYESTLCVGLARLGGGSKIRAGAAKDVMKADFGGPPHALIVPGKLHYMEEEMLKAFSDV